MAHEKGQPWSTNQHARHAVNRGLATPMHGPHSFFGKHSEGNFGQGKPKNYSTESGLNAARAGMRQSEGQAARGYHRQRYHGNIPNPTHKGEFTAKTIPTAHNVKKTHKAHTEHQKAMQAMAEKKRTIKVKKGKKSA